MEVVSPPGDSAEAIVRHELALANRNLRGKIQQFPENNPDAVFGLTRRS
jgi:hypothetical protein